MSTRFIAEVRENDSWREIDTDAFKNNLTKEQLKAVAVKISSELQRQVRLRKVVESVFFISPTPKVTIPLVDAA